MKDRCKHDQREMRMAVYLWRRIKATKPLTIGEFYLEVGKAVRVGIGHGLLFHEVARGIGFSIADCALALLFAESPDCLRLAAMVEDWSWETIKKQVRRVHASGRHAREKHRDLPEHDALASESKLEG